MSLCLTSLVILCWLAPIAHREKTFFILPPSFHFSLLTPLSITRPQNCIEYINANANNC